MKKKHILGALTIYIAFVFIQSLFFKFTNAPETQHIFGTLDQWAGGFGLAGIFAPTGVFSQYVVGTAELVASSLLLLGLFLSRPLVQALGAFMAVKIMSGAIFFHLFTPLGIEVEGDGGLLFGMACGIWVAALAILFMRKNDILDFIRSL